MISDGHSCKCSSDGGVRVAVRVRPFNKRENDRFSTTIISMDGNRTVIRNPLASNEAPRSFTFDYSYQSNDVESTEFASQETVFNDLGRSLLNEAFDGFNACLFAYGQTGAGKSYSMMGISGERGIIPRFAEELFERIDYLCGTSDSNVKCKVEVSYMEIYNERVRDLLNPRPAHLRVREHPVLGPYVEDLSRHVVTNFDQIERLMNEGAVTRTTASTNMNAVSSRSHAIFTIILSQARYDVLTRLTAEKTSKVRLVDLAGSERASSTGASGKRLKESANINKSLSTLSKVISALADISMGKTGKGGKDLFVPFRDSTLTWLLKDSLAGNSKTAMIAAISPADINYEETLNTLRYANQAKDIKTKAVINEDPKAKLIREMTKELEELRARLVACDNTTSSNGLNSDMGALAALGLTVDGVVQEIEEHKNEASKLRDQLITTEKLMQEINLSWEEKLEETRRLESQRHVLIRQRQLSVDVVESLPHLINQDTMSKCLIVYLLNGITTIGRAQDENSEDDSSSDDDVAVSINDSLEAAEKEDEGQRHILLYGADILEEHAVLQNECGVVTVEPSIGADVAINSERITEVTRLSHGCLVRFGSHVFLFAHPREAKRQRKESRRLLLNSKINDSGTEVDVGTDILLKDLVEEDHGPENEIRTNVETISYFEDSTVKEEFLSVEHQESSSDNEGTIRDLSPSTVQLQGENQHWLKRSPQIANIIRDKPSHSPPKMPSEIALRKSREIPVSPCEQSIIHHGVRRKLIDDASMVSSPLKPFPKLPPPTMQDFLGSKDASIELGFMTTFTYEILDEDKLISMLITNMNECSMGFKLIPAYILYMMTSYALTTFGEKHALSLFRKITQLIQRRVVESTRYLIFNMIKTRGDVHMFLTKLLFWLANVSELLHIIKHDDGILVLIGECQVILTDVVLEAYQKGALLLQRYLYSILPAVLEENSLGLFARNKKKVAQETMSYLLDALSSWWSCMVNCLLVPSIRNQLVGQLFGFINAFIFNAFMQNRIELFCWERGMQVRFNIAKLEEWAAAHGFRDIAESSLKRAVQVCQLLQEDKSDISNLDRVCESCRDLNSLQVSRIFAGIVDSTQTVHPNMADSVVDRSRSETDVKLRSGDGPESRLPLELSTSTFLPFRFPSEDFHLNRDGDIPSEVLVFLKKFNYIKSTESRGPYDKDMNGTIGDLVYSSSRQKAALDSILCLVDDTTVELDQQVSSPPKDSEHIRRKTIFQRLGLSPSK